MYPLTCSLFRKEILTARPEECGVAGIVAVWFALMLSVAARGQRFVALLATQTGAVPVLPQGRLSLSCGHKGTKYINYLGFISSCCISENMQPTCIKFDTADK